VTTGAGPREAFEVTVDGVPVTARAGASIAAVLLDTGHASWRETRVAGRPRGLFCGIGVCFDCLVTVNGRPNQRACVTPARPGDAITAQHGTGFDEYEC
jgi:predicted molibdopterin-dependent oxidoreductase YjgC